MLLMNASPATFTLIVSMLLKIVLIPIVVAIVFKIIIDYDLLGSKFSIIVPMVLNKHIWLRFTKPIYKHKENIVWRPGSFRAKNGHKESMPNILLILVDDLGFNDLSGGCGVNTPNIDSIRRNGVSFTQAYSGQATCAPSRAALLTGRFSTRFGSEFTPGPKGMARILTIPKPDDLIQPILHQDLLKILPPMSEMVLPINETMIGNVLQDGGYDTYHIGKWDSGPDPGYRAMERGFNESLSFNLGASPYLPENHPDLINGFGNNFDDFLRLVTRFHIEHNNGPKMEPDKYMTDYLTEHAVSLVHSRAVKAGETQQMDPFFISLAYNAPHNPYQALKSDYEDPEVQKLPTQMAKVYAAMVKALDRGVGKVLQALKDANVHENTVVIFTSDNGGAHYAGFPKANHPFRGWKGSLFEGGIHVPMFMQWPKVVAPPSECTWDVSSDSDTKVCEQLTVNSPVAHVDFFTSFASLTRTTAEARKNPLARGAQLDGINIFDLVRAAVRKRAQISDAPAALDSDDLVYTAEESVDETPEQIQEALTEQQSQTRTLYWRSGHYMAVRVGDWKLQIALRPNKVWFFHLGTDPSEHRNLALEVNVTTQQSLQDVLAVLPPIDAATEGVLERRDVTGATLTPDYVALQLRRIHRKLEETNSQQVPPRWPAASETPVTIDKVFKDAQQPGDEYVHWPN